MRTMEQRDHDEFWTELATYIAFVPGTEVKKAVTAKLGLLRSSDWVGDLVGLHTFFDWQTRTPRDLATCLGRDPDEFITPDSFVPAVVPDKESLAKAEQEGKLCHMPAGWYEKPGAVLDNLGAAGDPRIGLALAKLNETALVSKLDRNIQRAMEHDRHLRLVLADMDVGSLPSRLAIFGYSTSVGATGNGAIYWFPDVARRCADRHGVQAKVVLNILLRGTLRVQDQERADLNELTLLKYFRALASGKYIDPVTGQLMPSPFDLLFLAADNNAHGTLSTLDRLVYHQAHCDNVVWHTPAGTKIRQRLGEIEAWDSDEDGDPRAAMTVSCAFVSRDSKRVLGYDANRGSSILAENLRAKSDPSEIRKRAAGLARLHELVESEEDNQITSRILRPAVMGGENVLERARADLTDRVGKVRGFRRAVALAEALDALQNGDIPETFEEAMKKQAQARFQGVKDGLEKEFDQTMRTLEGLHQAQQITAFLKAVVENSRKEVTAKIHELQEIRRPHEEIIAEALEELQHLQDGGWAARLLHPFLPGRIAANLEESGRVAIDCQLQIVACVSAARNFLTPLADHLDRRLAWLMMLEQKLQDVAGSCKQKADHWARKSTALVAPKGFELATEDYLNREFEERLAEGGGARQFSASMLARFLSRHDSLANLAEMPIEEIQDVFTAICEEFFRPAVERTDVVSEFKRLYPDKTTQQRIFEQCLNQSEGSVLTTGEANRHVPWIKVAIVPSSDDVDWAGELVKGVDKKPGKWEVAIHPDPNRMGIIQLRGDVSLTPFIDRLDLPEPEDWAKVIARAPDPVSALTVGPNPDDRQLRRVITKALVTGQLRHDQVTGFALDSPDGNDVLLGQGKAAATEALRHSWPDLIFIESKFGRQVVLDDKTVAARLKQLEGRVNAPEPDADPLLCLIDSAAVAEAARQLELFLPWARRMRKLVDKAACS